jgi:acetolactate synthase-1/2/3 large subunit
MVRQWQDMFFNKRYASTQMVNPDFVKVATGFNIPAKRVSERKNLESSVKEMLAAESPYLLEVEVEKEGTVLPMVEPGASVSDIKLTY